MGTKGSQFVKDQVRSFLDETGMVKMPSPLDLLKGKGWKQTFGDEDEDSYKGFLSRPFCVSALANNKGNRDVNELKLNRIVDSINHDEWRYTSQPVIFSADGTLVDGQYRMMAYLKAGCPSGLKVKVSVLKDKHTVNNLYAIMGQQTTIQARDILSKVGFEDGAYATVANVILQFLLGSVGTNINKRSSLWPLIVNEYKAGMTQLVPLIRKNVSVSSPMVAATLLIGRAYGEEKRAIDWLTECAKYAYEIIPANQANTGAVNRLEKGSPVRTIAYWLADGGVSVKDAAGKKISSNGTYATRNGFSVIAHALLAEFSGKKFTKKQIVGQIEEEEDENTGLMKVISNTTLLQADACRRVEDAIKAIAKKNGMVLGSPSIN